MFNQLTSIGLGIVVFSLIIAVGTIVLQQFNVATACSTTYPYYNVSGGTCQTNATTLQPEGIATTTSGTTLYYMQGKLGTTSGGLASWTPAIIALSVGLMFIGALMLGKQKGRSY